MRLVLVSAIVAAEIAWASAAPAQTTAPAPRQVVYGFTWGTQSDLQVHSSGVDSAPGANGGSGISDFTGGLGDQGTITVELLAQQADSSLVIKVSEQAKTQTCCT